MNTEPDHLSQLLAAQRRLEQDHDESSARQAVDLLLKIAIANHQPVGLGVPAEEVPPFMEPGEPVTIPTTL